MSITKERIEQILNRTNRFVDDVEIKDLCQLALQAMNAKMPDIEEIHKAKKKFCSDQSPHGDRRRSAFLAGVKWLQERWLNGQG